MARNIRLIFPPILITIGVPGNLLSVIILYRLRKTQKSTFLVCLAVADLIFLGVFKMFDWIANLTNMNLVDTYGIICRIQVFGYCSSVQIASWMQVLVTMERVVSVASPHKVRLIFSPARSMYLVILMSIIVISVKIVLLIDTAAAHFSTDKYCFDSGNFHYIYLDFWPWMNLCVGYFIPWIALFVGSIVIVLLLRRKSTHGGSPLSEDKLTGKRRYKISVITKRVIALNVVYNICVTPTNIMSVLYLFGIPVSVLVYTILTILMVVNNSISFFFYILIGSKFKGELLKMMTAIKCRRCCSKEFTPSVTVGEKIRF